MACPEPLQLQAYFDGELEALAASQLEEHLAGCPQCSAHLEELSSLRAAIRRDVTPVQAPANLRARIAHALEAEAGAAAIARPAPRAWRSRPFWLGALGGVAAAAGLALFSFLLMSARLGGTLADELVAAHVRSLLPSHLIDVASSDRHTVKPWFAGHADVSPAVADFAEQGYRLIGGRADYIERQRAAVTVYQHGPHIINVFSWASGRVLPPANTTRNGYHLAYWKEGNLEYCAVSDTGWDELHGLVSLLKELSERSEAR
jgi:anti-sigma factor (TIGR02949 family)